MYIYSETLILQKLKSVHKALRCYFKQQKSALIPTKFYSPLHKTMTLDEISVSKEAWKVNTVHVTSKIWYIILICTVYIKNST